MKNIKIFTIVAILLILSACERVPPVHRGKILQPGGFEPAVLKPGKYWTGVRGEMVLIETATNTMHEPMSIIMSDKLTLRFDVKFRGRINGSDKTLNSMFDDISTQNNIITLAQVYKVYGKDVIRNKAREVLNVYSVNDVHENYKLISTQLAASILPELENTPLELSNVTLGNIQYPDIVTAAVERAEEKRQEIEQAEAEAEIAMTRKKNELVLAEADYQIKITKAKAIRDENKLLAEGITNELIEVKRLDLLESMIENNSEGNTIFLPVEALTSQGAQMRMYSDKK